MLQLKPKPICLAFLTSTVAVYIVFYLVPRTWSAYYGGRLLVKPPRNDIEILEQCSTLSDKPDINPLFYSRNQSDRFVIGTQPTLIKNARIWTSVSDPQKSDIGFVYLSGGLIKRVGRNPTTDLDVTTNMLVIDANGSWITPGLVDMHSHLGVASSPSLTGAIDTNSYKGPILPWLRSLDALNTHDDAYRTGIAGGVTSALILPGSTNAIGGEAVVIKLRPTEDRTPTAMVLENPYINSNASMRWKHMKHACGEHPKTAYKGTRMDVMWAWRQAYDKARQLKINQDKYCDRARKVEWEGLGRFPTDFQWQPLVDVLRGRTKIHVHCHEAVDIDDIVRLTNEFQFPVAAFHHADDTYMAPNAVKSTYGGPPAVALFAIPSRYNRESYRGSEFAPRILSDEGIKVIMKSDHPILNSRHLIFEVQQAHYYGLPPYLALSSVTSTPAEVLGLDHRIGRIEEGYDADVVLWDSHPLSLGATPKQVWIDGIPQLPAFYSIPKPSSTQDTPSPPNFDREAQNALDHDGLPPLSPDISTSDTVFFTNVSRMFLKSSNSLQASYFAAADDFVTVRDGRIVCQGSTTQCSDFANASARVINLMGGTISPGLLAVGSLVSHLGLEEIRQEGSTVDGTVPDPLLGDRIPEIVGGEGSMIKASLGLKYMTRHALLAHRSGVTIGVTPPTPRAFSGFLMGLSVAFATGAKHQLEKGAVVEEIAAVHVKIQHSFNVSQSPSVSSQIAALRALLQGKHAAGQRGYWFGEVAKGKIPLVIEGPNADIMATLIKLKREIESDLGTSMKFTFLGGSEAHLLASQIGQAGIGVILSPARPFPSTWESRRVLPGPPLTESDAISLLHSHNVTVGIGIQVAHEAVTIRFEAGYALRTAGGKLSEADALALASVNLEKLLGLDIPETEGDLVVTQSGGLLDFNGKVVAVISPRRGKVDIF